MNLPAAGSSRAAWVSKYLAAARPGQSAGSSASGRLGSVNRNLRQSWTSRLRAAKAAASVASVPSESTVRRAAASQSSYAVPSASRSQTRRTIASLSSSWRARKLSARTPSAASRAASSDDGRAASQVVSSSAPYPR
jgi:hypothetical protein